jgi:bcr-type benzoyl-CoA reductase subunit C
VREDRSLQMLRDLLTDPYAGWEGRWPGHHAIGYLCTYTPLEVLHAAGLTPVRLLGLSSTISRANAHLPGFCCALARGVTERMLSGELRFLKGVLFAHTCDTMQCVADIWRMSTPPFAVLHFSLPTVLDQTAALGYTLAELRRLAGALAPYSESPLTEDALRASVVLYNQQRQLLSRLYAQRERMTVEQLWLLTISGMLMPVQEHNVLLRSVLQVLEDDALARRDGPALWLIGAVLDDPAVPRLLDEMGARVVGDDLCTGSRYFDAPVDESSEPFAALAEHYLRRASCPAKHEKEQPRIQRLLDTVRSSAAQGVVFVIHKFCEPHAFDYVALAHALRDAGIPCLSLEMDVAVPVEQLRTRLQAFLEVLDEGRG